MANQIQMLLVLIGLILSGTGAAAQDQILGGDDPPPQLSLPDLPSGSGTRSQGFSESLPVPGDSFDGSELEPIADRINSGDTGDTADSFTEGDDLHIFDCEPAFLESTGSWLRRGFWFAEIDVVMADRIWTRDGLLLMGHNSSLSGFINNLRVDGGQFGSEAAPRLKVGRFLFRDHMNRDHNLEFVIYGGGQWTQGGRLDFNPNTELGDPATGQRLIVNPLLDRGNDSFDGAQTAQYTYDSRLNSFELNYKLATRMKRDRMELEPSGHWVRRAQPSLTRSLFAGIRYIDVTEGLLWEAFDIDDPQRGLVDEEGRYDVKVDNKLIGTQLGASFTHERARWSFGARIKSGMFLNHSNVDSRFEVTNSPTRGQNFIEEDNITFLVDGALIGKWHLRPNLSLRAGAEIMFLSALALAPDQLDFIPVSTGQVIANGDVSWMGGTIGLESYW